MYFWRSALGPVDLAFTDGEIDLAADLSAVTADFAPVAAVADMRQVHGARVSTATEGERVECDALATDRADLVLAVRVADCVPVLLADPGAGVIAAVHSGRLGLVAGVTAAAVIRMRELGATDIGAWIGPYICGGCYEVPQPMRAEVGALVPSAVATTTWGTPSLDIGAGVRAQLAALDVVVHDVSACTLESPGLCSHRRDGASAGRMAGLIRLRR